MTAESHNKCSYLCLIIFPSSKVCHPISLLQALCGFLWAPISLSLENNEWAKGERVMAAARMGLTAPHQVRENFDSDLEKDGSSSSLVSPG